MKRKVSDLLKEKGHAVYTISDNAKMKDVVKRFNEKRIGALMVVNEQGDIEGIVTERDIMIKLGRTEGEVKDMSVQLMMTTREKLVVATLEDDIEYLMKMMTSNRIRHIPIVDGESKCKLHGVISIRDVVKALLSNVELKEANKLLKDYLDGGYPV